MDGVSVFVGSLIAVVVILGAIAEPRNERDPRRSLVAFLGLFLAASTRDLLWIYVGFEAFSLAAIVRHPKLRGAPGRARAMAGSGASLLGVLFVAVSSRATDLVELESTTAVNLGVLLFAAGLIIKWLQSQASPFLFLGASVALVAVFVRVEAWAPGIADEARDSDVACRRRGHHRRRCGLGACHVDTLARSLAYDLHRRSCRDRALRRRTGTSPPADASRGVECRARAGPYRDEARRHVGCDVVARLGAALSRVRHQARALGGPSACHVDGRARRVALRRDWLRAGGGAPKTILSR